MQVHTAQYAGQTIRYSIILENGILFNTLDVCRILRIPRRPLSTILYSSCLNMVGIIKMALTDGRNEMELVEWLENNFIGYEIETPVIIECDEEWNQPLPVEKAD